MVSTSPNGSIQTPDATNAPPTHKAPPNKNKGWCLFLSHPIQQHTNPQASADMADPDKRAEWQDVADNSNGRYKTARGAALASYYADAIE